TAIFGHLPECLIFVICVDAVQRLAHVALIVWRPYNWSSLTAVEVVMSVCEWEQFEEILLSSRYRLTDSGPLYGPVKSFSIKRNSKHQIILSTISAGNAKTSEVEWPPGTLRVNTDVVYFEDYLGCTARAVGVIGFDHRKTDNYISGGSVTKQESIVGHIEATFPNVTVDMQVDWFINMDDGSLLWPHSKRVEEESTRTVRWISGNDELILNSSDNMVKSGSSCFALSVAGNDIIIGRSHSELNEGPKRGYILYKKETPDDVRRKIKDCVSFALGIYLVYVGTAGFSKDGGLGYFKSISAYTIGDRVFEIYRSPAAPLGFTYQGELDPALTSRIINSLFDAYDQYRFEDVFWQYWHAHCAPYHAAAVHYGAAIESLQKRYIEVSGKLSIGSILLKKDWRELRKKIILLLDSGGFSESEAKLLSQQIDNLNRAPQKVVMERFLDSLDIPLGALELSAWQQRNNAAHGNELVEDGHIDVIRGSKLLRIMFDRMILKMTNASDHYVDYYSPTFPVRRLTEAVPAHD
ncbi:hypothetical protein, partial [Pseudomonas sp. MH10]